MPGEQAHQPHPASVDAILSIRSEADERRLLAAPAGGKQVVGALPSLEGTHAREGDAEKADELFGLGFRVLGMVIDSALASPATIHDVAAMTDRR